MKARLFTLGVLVVANTLWASAPETFSLFPKAIRVDETMRLSLVTAVPRGVTESERRQSEIRILLTYAVQLRAELAVLSEAGPERAVVVRRLSAVMRRVNELSAGLTPSGTRATP